MLGSFVASLSFRYDVVAIRVKYLFPSILLRNMCTYADILLRNMCTYADILLYKKYVHVRRHSPRMHVHVHRRSYYITMPLSEIFRHSVLVLDMTSLSSCALPWRRQQYVKRVKSCWTHKDHAIDRLQAPHITNPHTDPGRYPMYGCGENIAS